MTKENESALKMLATALDMEEKGEAFYEKAMNECKTEPGGEIFRMLMTDELVHIYRIKKIYASLNESKAWSDEWRSDEIDEKSLGEFFEKITQKHGRDIQADAGDLDAMDIGIDFELKSIKYYEEHLTKASGPHERDFLNRMIIEERSHYDALVDMKLYLVDPDSWFREKERSGLDGP